MYKQGRWNLTELASDHKSPEFAKQIKQLESKVKNFEKVKAKLKPSISSKEFFGIIHNIEDLTEDASRLGGYASLLYSSDTQSDEATSLLTKMSKLGSEIENKTLFFDLWWKRKIDEKNATRLIRDAGNLSEFLIHKRLLAKYSLSEPEEKIINTLDVTGSTALVKLYDKITNAFEYVITINGKKKKMTREQLSVLVRSTNPNLRKTAYQTLLGKFHSNKGVLGEIYQNLVLNWKDEGIEIRKYSSPISIRNIGNDVDDKTIQVLLDVCKKNSSVFYEFFAFKAKSLGLKKLRRYDLYAPSAKKFKEKDYTYEKATALVLDSLNKFSPTLSKNAQKVFSQNHIDSQIRPGKRDGAFCSTISPKLTPYVLVNYAGKSKDVFTLAHELGHAVHSQAASKQSILVSEAPLPLAETASTFSELLLYDNIADSMTDTEKAAILSEKIDDIYATVMRQAFFTIFEIDAHKQIADGTTIEEISETYLHNLKTQFGNSIELSDDFSLEWSCIPHFYHTPFYCYAYSFGNLLSLSLFQMYQREGKQFEKTYLEILAAGGSKKPETLLNEYGINISSAKFWQDGFDYIRSQVKELIAIK
ncbi:MAG: M3 family oligoendopeptidase [Nitrososphaeria archaeon]|nr:M3 family oligoendopeptidase [Nitrososphaeria archaeon]NDB50843.1 M3 family oligoendopeptidase [Nitrosopumilaceae archaeon]NDB88226.1 M3 family oligoendopeptidase [Nitrososphaerota archaeon]NDB46012.1 M3 family oligoendopeptidase [Nitrososphaeria archaeon]NDB89536.1 M3 family oligoendopeptidase [Nitrososphaerota archaeon]